MSKFFSFITAFCLTLFTSSNIRADTPLPPASEHQVMSQNAAFIAISNPSNGTRVINRRSKQTLWSMPGWYRALYVSNDGNYVVTVYDGMNLIPIDYRDDLVLLTFWAKGKTIKNITIKQIVPQSAILARTASHYHWGTINGINEEGYLVVQRVDGKNFLFDVKTGIRQ